MGKVSGETMTIMAYDHISLMPAGHSMVTKRIKRSTRAEWALDRPEVFNPSHHLMAIWY